MEDVVHTGENSDEQPDLLGDVARMVESAAFNADRVRRVRRLLKGMTDGCVVIVVNGGNVAEICQVTRFILGPAEK